MIYRSILLRIACALGVVGCCMSSIQTASAVEPADVRTSNIKDWEELQYGMFIHYGMSTFTGGEFGEIPAENSVYKPTKLDVDQWIRVAKNAGMRYAVLTTKHCYGHCLWPTETTEYNVANTPVKTDVVNEFVKACRKYKIKPGFYYLLGWDRHHQTKMTPAEYEAFVKKQVTELLKNYGPITEIWFDIPWDMGEENPRVLAEIYDLVKKIQPKCLVLLNQGFRDGSTVLSLAPSYAGNATKAAPSLLWPKDINNGEITMPPDTGHNPKIQVNGKTYYLPMETCNTLCRNWFWLPQDVMRTVSDLFIYSMECRKRGANLLLDVAPDRTGQIPQASIDRLMALKKVVDAGSYPVNLVIGATATASNTYNNDAAYGPQSLTDGDFRSRWAADEKEHEAWVAFEFAGDITFNEIVVTEGWDRVQAYRIEVMDSVGEWKPIFRGSTMGPIGKPIRVPDTVARKVRLYIEKATVGPTIWDFELFKR